MNKNYILLAFVALIFAAGMVSSLSVDANFITIYPGEQGRVSVNVENNQNMDFEDIRMQLNLNNVPFTSVGSSEKQVDDLDEGDDDTVSFELRASTDIKPGDYNIPYKIDYVNVDDDNETFTQEGSFGIRVSAKTELDFVVDAKNTNGEGAIVNRDGEISLEIINTGLGEIKSMTVQVLPEGYKLLSSDKTFVGTIDSDDTDITTFDVYFTSNTPIFKAIVTYKDFENQDQVKNINLPMKVYTEDEAKELGLIGSSSWGIYITIIIVLIIVWFVYRRIRKSRKRKEKKRSVK